MAKKQNQKKQTSPKKINKYDIKFKINASPDEALKVLINIPPNKKDSNKQVAHLNHFYY